MACKVVTGVHLNECILKRPFGIRQMLREGFNVVVVSSDGV